MPDQIGAQPENRTGEGERAEQDGRDYWTGKGRSDATGRKEVNRRTVPADGIEGLYQSHIGEIDIITVLIQCKEKKIKQENN